MSHLPQRLSVFVDDGRTERSHESFQGLSFEKIEQSGKAPISFFRSDFRKTRITDCTFRGNNFSRCDFISSTFRNTSFIECNFLTSSIMYSVFYDCTFDNNKDFNPDLFRCRLSSCIFRNQAIARATWRDTSFISCSFINCTIERSTLQNIEFLGCNLDGFDLSQMSANDIHFANTSVEGATIDPDYLGTYTFENVDLGSMHFEYRSADLDFSTSNFEDFMALARHFEAQQRWSEAFNILALLCQVSAEKRRDLSLEEAWERCLLGALDLEIPADAAENVRRLFRLAKHYLRLGLLTISACLRFVAVAELVEHLTLDTLVLEELTVGATSLLRTIETLPNMERALAADVRSATSVRFQVQVDTDDENFAKDGILTFLTSTAGRQGIPFNIIKIGFGSIVIEAATWFIIVMMLFRAARSASYTLVEIRLILKARDRLAQIMDQSLTPKDIINTVKRVHQSFPGETTVTDLVGDEIAEIGRTFHDLMHEVKAGGKEFLTLVREVRIFIDDLRKHE
jgi:uncharacterized protein YjbI with pentapeptide repeats